MCRSCSSWTQKLQYLLPQLCEPLKSIEIRSEVVFTVWSLHLTQLSCLAWTLLCVLSHPSLPPTLKWNKPVQTSGSCSALHEAYHHSSLSSFLSQVLRNFVYSQRWNWRWWYGGMCCEVKKKNVDRNDGQCFRVTRLPIWENSPFLRAVICGASVRLAAVTFFKTSYSSTEVDSLEFALATELLTSHNCRIACYGCRRLQ